jgi:hypothetical protein
MYAKHSFFELLTEEYMIATALTIKREIAVHVT